MHTREKLILLQRGELRKKKKRLPATITPLLFTYQHICKTFQNPSRDGKLSLLRTPVRKSALLLEKRQATACSRLSPRR